MSANAEGDCLLVTGGMVDEIIKAPCTAGYVPGEQALVVKISAKDLLAARQRRDEQERVANEMLTEWLQSMEPVNDWLVALDVPLMGHSMCSGIGYSQSPNYKRSGPRR
jgi:hypothetical protein